jgi:hypothetical protein
MRFLRASIIILLANATATLAATIGYNATIVDVSGISIGSVTVAAGLAGGVAAGVAVCAYEFFVLDKTSPFLSQGNKKLEALK